jgi:hypothetical protein
MTDLERLGRQKPGIYFIYFMSPVRDPGKILKISLRIAKIRTRYLPNTSTERHSYGNPPGCLFNDAFETASRPDISRSPDPDSVRLPNGN